jgi:hypothetical protein
MYYFLDRFCSMLLSYELNGINTNLLEFNFMFTNKKLINSLVTEIRKIENSTLKALLDGRIEQETAVTDRLLGAMEHNLNNKNIAGVRWTVKTLTDKGSGAQEKEFGADFLAAFEFSLDGYKVAKGFLAQSKLIEPSQTLNTKEFNRLKEQCEKMLSHSSASFVFLYSQQSGIVVIPAIEVIAARACNPHELISKKMTAFYREHFECFLGDKEIHSANPQSLEALRDRYRVRTLTVLTGSGENEPSQMSLDF